MADGRANLKPFKSGAEWTGNRNGRPKGSKSALRVDALGILSREGFCPFVEAVKLYRKPGTGVTAKVEILNSLQKYIAPTLKALDVSASDGAELNLTLNLGIAPT